jgi:hypothetical protein
MQKGRQDGRARNNEQSNTAQDIQAIAGPMFVQAITNVMAKADVQAKASFILRCLGSSITICLFSVLLYHSI